MSATSMRTVLLAEPTAGSAWNRAAVIARHGFAVSVANTPEELLHKVPAAPPRSLVLLDMDLGGQMNGLPMARRLLEDRDLPIVFLVPDECLESDDPNFAGFCYGCLPREALATSLVSYLDAAFSLFDARRKLRRSEDRFQASPEPQMLATEEKYRHMFENAPIGAFRSLPSGRFEEVNGALATMLGYDSPEAVLSEVNDIARQIYVDPAEREPIVAFVKSNREQAQFIVTYYRRNKERWIGRLSLRAIRDAAGQPETLEGFVEDVTASVSAEERLRQYQRAVESSRQMIFAVDRSYRYVFANQAYLDYHAVQRDQVEGREIRSVLGDEMFFATVKPNMDRCLAGRHVDYETKFEFPVRGLRHVRVRYSPIPAEERVGGLVVVVDDITELETARAETRRLIEEKDTLLLEVHHRIKNDLNLIQSLLSLQAREKPSSAAREALEEASNRVAVMSRIYDNLYRGGDLKAVRLRTLLDGLMQDVLQSFAIQKVAVHSDVDDVTLPPRRCLTIGMIVNELVTNALKYAYVGVADPSLAVTVSHEGLDRAVVVVHDNGVGMPNDVATGERSGFGLWMIRALARQHEGEVAVQVEDGTTVTVTI